LYDCRSFCKEQKYQNISKFKKRSERKQRLMPVILADGTP